MARGWYGNKEAHSRAAKRGWVNRRAKQGIAARNNRDMELAKRRLAGDDKKFNEAMASEQARLKAEKERTLTAAELARKKEHDAIAAEQALRKREQEWEKERARMKAYRKKHNISFATGKKRETKQRKKQG